MTCRKFHTRQCECCHFRVSFICEVQRRLWGSGPWRLFHNKFIGLIHGKNIVCMELDLRTGEGVPYSNSLGNS